MDLTFYSDATDGYIDSEDNSPPYSYTVAVEGTGTFTVSDTAIQPPIGQDDDLTGYHVYQTYLYFPISNYFGVWPYAINSATLSLYGQTNSSETDFTIEAYYYDWGTTLTSANFRTPTQLAALTKVATFATSGFSTSQYNVFTSEASFPATLASDPHGRFVVVSSRNVSSTQPSAASNEWVQAYSGSNATNKPRLVISGTIAVKTPRKYVSLSAQLKSLGY